jgi:hypothetical protein
MVGHPEVTATSLAPYAGRDAFYREQGRVVRAFCREHRIRGTIDA